MGSGSVEFDGLRNYLDNHREVKRELEFAFTSLLAAANPSDRGSRFAYGGGAEWIMAAVAWCAGILTAPAGHNANGFDLTDLLDRARGLWSVKASASLTSSSIRLTNFMGSGKSSVWDVPTLFVGPYLGGAVLIDPRQEREIQQATKREKDALTLSARKVRDFAGAHPLNKISFDVAVNDGRTQGDRYALIKSILVPQHFPNLSAPFVAAEPPKGRTKVSEIERLIELRDNGEIDDKQFRALVDDLARPLTSSI